MAYRMGGLGFFEFLLSADSFRDFSLRVMTLERQSSHDEDLILKLRRTRAELRMRESDLQGQKKVQASQRSALAEQVKGLNASMAEAQTLVKGLQAKLSREEQQRLFRAFSGGGRGVAAGGNGRVVSLAACPAAGPHAFSNDWGAPRGGGRRRHRGNDIFAPMGSAAAAVVSGRISRLGSGGLGGLSVYLFGDDGNEYYYAHMQSFKVSQGQRVSAGQTIATVGNTGNARGGAPHIHFEIHPGGGGAINPYYSLIRAC
jgi:murein DD-endopeptidase MepM/ murein hydrolase activator NlpD